LGIISDNLKKRGWSWGCVAAVDSRGRTIFVADAHRGDGQRFVVRADELLTAFLELESEVSKRQGKLKNKEHKTDSYKESDRFSGIRSAKK